MDTMANDDQTRKATQSTTAPSIQSFTEWIQSIADSQDVAVETVETDLIEAYWLIHELEAMLADHSSVSPRRSAADTVVSIPPAHPSTDEDETAALPVAFEPLSDRVTATQTDIDRLETRLESLDEETATDIAQLIRYCKWLKRQLERVAQATEATATDEAVTALTHECRAHATEVNENLAAIACDFGLVEQICSGLLERVEATERESEALHTLLDDLETRIEWVEVIDRLESIKLQANQLGLRTVKCEECGKSVDLSLLTRPVCPGCGIGFSTLRQVIGWLRTKWVLAPGYRQLGDGI